MGGFACPCRAASRPHAKGARPTLRCLTPLYLVWVAAAKALVEKKRWGTANATRKKDARFYVCVNGIDGGAKNRPMSTKVALPPSSPAATPTPPKGSGSIACGQDSVGPGPPCSPLGSARSLAPRSCLRDPARPPSSRRGWPTNSVPSLTLMRPTLSRG